MKKFFVASCFLFIYTIEISNLADKILVNFSDRIHDRYSTVSSYIQMSSSTSERSSSLFTCSNSVKKQASEIRMPALSINYQRSAISGLAYLAGLIAGCYSSVSGSKSDLVAALHLLCVMYTFGKVYALYYSLYTVGGTFIMDMSLPL